MISKTWRTSFLKSVRLETDGVKDVSQVQGSDISAACRRNLRAWYSYSNFAIVITNGSGFALRQRLNSITTSTVLGTIWRPPDLSGQHHPSTHENFWPDIESLSTAECQYTTLRQSQTTETALDRCSWIGTY